jgi:hypothetical protein
MIDVLLATFFDIINTQHDYKTGNADQESFNEAKKRFVQALNEFVDYRVREQLDIRRTSLSQERIAAADSINASITSTASTIRSLNALVSAPPPPKDSARYNEWVKNYQDWYENGREKGMNIG